MKTIKQEDNSTEWYEISFFSGKEWVRGREAPPLA
jgi:hypothetical protein